MKLNEVDGDDTGMNLQVLYLRMMSIKKKIKQQIDIDIDIDIECDFKAPPVDEYVVNYDHVKQNVRDFTDNLKVDEEILC